MFRIEEFCLWIRFPTARSDLVHMMRLTESVKGHTHGVQHTYHLHRVESRAHGSEADYVAEQNGDRGKFSASVERCFSIAQLVCYGLGDHLKQQSVCLLDTIF